MPDVGFVESRDGDDRKSRGTLTHTGQKPDSCGAGHGVVGEHDVKGLLIQQGQGLSRRRGGNDRSTLKPQTRLEHDSAVLMVFDDEDTDALKRLSGHYSGPGRATLDYSPIEIGL